MLGAVQVGQVASWIGDDLGRLGAVEVRPFFDDAIHVVSGTGDGPGLLRGLVRETQRGFALRHSGPVGSAGTGAALSPEVAAAMIGGGEAAGHVWPGMHGVVGARLVDGTVQVTTVSPHRASQLRNLLRAEAAGAQITVESAPIRTVWPPT